MSRQAIVSLLRTGMPGLLAFYAFGSRVRGDARPDSDLDLAVLVEGHADPLRLWTLAGDLADIAGCPVDMLDLRAATTVMQYQVVTTGERWWQSDTRVLLFEAMILSEKTELDTARAGLLADIAQRGSIHGR